MDSTPSLLILLGAGLDSAIAGNHLPNPNVSKELERSNEGDSRAYIKALRARLIDLGYLEESVHNRIKERADDHFKAAALQFQQDAGLVQDGWAGPKTWAAMECLVSFENKQDLDEWQSWLGYSDELAVKPLVLRAVYLRLHSMGFFTDWERDKLNTTTQIRPEFNLAFAQALRQFSRFATALGLYNLGRVPDPGQLDRNLLAAIFGYDAIIDKLGQEDFYSAVAGHYQSVIEAIVRIELWLQGYDVTPGRERFARVRTGGKPGVGAGQVYKRVSTFRAAIKNFWRDMAATKRSENEVSFALMSRFRQMLHEESRDMAVDAHLNDEIANIVSKEEDRNTLIQQFNNIASSIWDGFQRLAKWLFNAIKRIAHGTIDFIANIARYISRNARRLFSYVVKAVDLMHGGLVYLQNRPFFSQVHPACAVAAHQCDFDQFCCIDAAAPQNQLRLFTQEYRGRAERYAAATRIVSHLLRIFATIVKAMTGPTGWLSALLALSRLACSIKHIRRELNMVEDHIVEGSNPMAALANDVH